MTYKIEIFFLIIIKKIFFQINFNKNYSTPLEDSLRREIFLNNLHIIKRHNLKGHRTFEIAINQYSDFTFDEILRMNEPIDISEFNFENLIELNAENFPEGIDVKVPDTFDWRERGIITRVRDQGLCGSCYAFSALNAIESQLILNKNQSYELSTQELIDCGMTHGTLHCLGGVTEGVFSYINFNEGISEEKNYPYEGVQGVCKNPIKKVNFSIKGYWKLENEDEETVKKALFLYGPIIALFDCLHELFIKYSSGIYYDDECLDSKEFSHAVLIVGYGSEKGIDYWIVKNSWGEMWGERGFFRIARNKNYHCQIGKFGQIPILN